jgi:NADH:quinone reductase (non-electrogenic)
MSPVSPKPRVVVVGGGAGGAELAAALGRRIGREAAEIILVDCAVSHLWKPRLHEVAAGLLASDEDALSYPALGHANHFRFHLGALTGLDPLARTISITGIQGSDGREIIGPRVIPYDTLILAIGSQVNDFGIEGVVDHCHVLDSGEQASVFQRQLLERAVQVADGPAREIRIGIVGAGATGVELAAELHHAVDALKRYGGLVGESRLAITLIDMSDRVLTNSDLNTSAFAERRLAQLGVDLRLNASVERVTAEAFVLKTGEEVPCDLKVWASGIIGRKVVEQLKGLQIGRGRRIVCDGFLHCVGLQDVYGLGDCAAVPDVKTDKLLPATAQVAHQQAAYLADVIVGSLHGRQPAPFKYRPMGSLISLGARSAAGEFPATKQGSVTMNGLLPKAFYVLLQFLHRAALVGCVHASALSCADALRKTTAPVVKLH